MGSANGNSEFLLHFLIMHISELYYGVYQLIIRVLIEINLYVMTSPQNNLLMDTLSMVIQ